MQVIGCYQTPPKLGGFYRTEGGFRPDFADSIIHKSFTGPTHFLSANVQGPVSFAVLCYQPPELSNSFKPVNHTTDIN